MIGKRDDLDRRARASYQRALVDVDKYQQSGTAITWALGQAMFRLLQKGRWPTSEEATELLSAAEAETVFLPDINPLMAQAARKFIANPHDRSVG